MATLKEAIKTLESWKNEDEFAGLSEAIRTVLPHVVEWPADCTKQTLDGFADSMKANGHIGVANALRALAAIAPERKKRVVNLWECPHISHDAVSKPIDWKPDQSFGWRCVARKVELDG